MNIITVNIYAFLFVLYCCFISCSVVCKCPVAKSNVLKKNKNTTMKYFYYEPELGVRIFTKEGEIKVYSVTDGVVEKVDTIYDRLFLMVKNDSNVFLYKGLKNVSVVKGDVMKIGKIIGELDVADSNQNSTLIITIMKRGEIINAENIINCN